MALALALAGCGVLPGGGESPTPTPEPPAPTPTVEVVPSPTAPQPLAWEEVVAKLQPSTVMIIADFPETAISYENVGFGTGFVYTDDGYIVTNAHVVEGAAAITVVPPGSNRERPARFVGVSTCDDLAVIKVDDMESLAPAAFGSSDELKVGEEVMALGYPFGAEIGTDLSVTRGIVSKLDFQLPPYQSLIQTDTPINPGTSGGPLVNRRGEVVGINTLGADPSMAQDLNFAISIDEARPIISELEQGRNRLWLGMNLVPNLYEDYFGTSDGLVVAAVASGSPASSAGVQPAYLLTKLEGLSVNSMADVCKILRSHKDGDGLKVQFMNVTDTEIQILEGEIIIGEPTASAPVQVVARQSFAADVPTVPASGGSTTAGSWDFSMDDGDWYTGDFEDSVIEIRDGAYHITFKEGGWYRVAGPQSIASGGDQAIMADVRVLKGVAGVVLRFTNNAGNLSFYLCYITSEATYGCGVFVDSQYTSLVEPKPSNLFYPGDFNTLVMSAIGGRITFAINGTQVAAFDDSSVSRGIPGVYAEGFSDVPGQASFDNVSMEVAP